jgi:hypothetical protein
MLSRVQRFCRSARARRALAVVVIHRSARRLRG